jgi:hypothetical protein
MIRQYEILAETLQYYTWAEANQEIVDFKYTWENHPESGKYVRLLRMELDTLENYLGV